MPKVSVIIPVYNAEKYLVDTLDSVLGQTFTDLEVVCVDDGSVDSSAKILKRYQQKDSRVKTYTQKNSGGSAARNAGIRHASGEYVMFLDADDMYEKHIVANAYNRAKQTGADIVLYGFSRFVGKPTKMAVVNKVTPNGELKYFTKQEYADRLFNDFAIITWNKLVKRDLILNKNILFDTKLSHNHDVDFSIRLMLAAESFSWLNAVGYYYRSNEGGLTATKRSDPTNVLKILLNLNTLIATGYDYLQPSFNRYIADMITGTLIKYSNSTSKMREVFDFAHDIVLPEVGLMSTDMKDESEIFKLVESGDFKKFMSYMNHPKRKMRKSMRRMYDTVQGILARFTV